MPIHYTHPKVLADVHYMCYRVIEIKILSGNYGTCVIAYKRVIVILGLVNESLRIFVRHVTSMKALKQRRGIAI